MFTYIPLSETLREKKLNLEELCDMAGINENLLMCKLNNKEYISLENLDKICNALKVPVEKIIEWKEGKQSIAEKYLVNWDYVFNVSRDKGISLNELSEKCRLDRSSLSHAKQRNSKLSEWTVKLIAKNLKCSIQDIILEDNND